MFWGRARMTRNKLFTLGLGSPLTHHHYLPKVDSQQQDGKNRDYPRDGSAAISFDSIHPDSPGYNIQKETPMSFACRKMVRTTWVSWRANAYAVCSTNSVSRLEGG